LEDTGDSTPTLLVFFDSKRYLFNCGEGTQRFCTEHRVRLARVDNIFITRLSWENVGGLPGAILTITDVGVNQINLYGPPNMLNFVEATRYFISRHDLTMSVTEWMDHSSEPQNVFQDDCMKVIPILVLGKDEEEILASMPKGSSRLHSDADFEAQSAHISDQYGQPGRVASHILYKEGPNDYGVQGSWQVKLQQEYCKTEDFECPVHESTPGVVPPLLKRTKPTQALNSVVCYACHAADVPGKFDVKLADALGVPAKMRSLLVKGQSITLDNGSVVQPSQCVHPSTPGRIMLVVHGANQSVVDALVQHPAFNKYQLGGHFAQQVAVIIHMTPGPFIAQPAYQQWMASFGSQAEHLVVNADHCSRPIVFNSSTANQLRLNSLHPIIFRPASETQTPSMALPQLFASAASSAAPSNDISPPSALRITAAKPLMKFHLSPISAVGLDVTEVSPDMDLASVMAAFSEEKNPKFHAHRAELRAHYNAHTTACLKANPTGRSPPYYVVFLGTGAALPSKYRNVSSTFVKLESQPYEPAGSARSKGSFLLDAGEGTFGQLSRHYVDRAQLNSILRDLRAIFISHMHADHHLGVMRILVKRAALMGPNAPPLLIIAPPHYRNWIEEYNTIEPLNYILFNAYDLSFPAPPQTRLPSFKMDTDVASSAAEFASSSDSNSNSKSAQTLPNRLQELLGITQLYMVPVIHCPDAFGVVITHQDGWKMVFSGDTRPCPLLDQAGIGCDLLIHEATFEDQLTHEAEEKKHATTTEAIQAAMNMRAKFLMMTHFSQRYPKIPVFDERYTATTGVAFDLMRVSPDDFPFLPHLLPCLQDLFDEVEAGENKADEAAEAEPPTKKPKKK
jgi:ribonuclease Z